MSSTPLQRHASNWRLARCCRSSPRKSCRSGTLCSNVRNATKKDMDRLLEAIDEIEEKTSGQKHGKGLLDRIESLFEEARDASQPPTKSA